MGGTRLSRAAESHQLGARVESYPFSGLAWFYVILWPLAAAAGLREVLAGVGPAVACLVFGVLTRTNKAVHVFDGGIVLTGMWGQVKQVGRWPEISVRVKRTQNVRSDRYAHQVSLADGKGFGFAWRQVVRSQDLARTLADRSDAARR